MLVVLKLLGSIALPTYKRAEQGLEGWIECYPESRLAGTLFCGGVNDAREIEGNSKLLEAFEMGKAV